MIGYAKSFDSNKTMSFKTADKNLKTKIKSYGGKVNTNFQGNITLKENASYKCLSLII